MDPTYYTSPLSPTRWAPLSYVLYGSSSGSEPDPLSNSDEDDGLNGSESESVRKKDDDMEEEEEDDEVIDDVDGDGFPIAARVPNLSDRNPNLDNVMVGNNKKDGAFEGLEVEDEDVDRGLGGNPDSGENFAERLDLDDSVVESDMEVVKLDGVGVERDEEAEVNSEDDEKVLTSSDVGDVAAHSDQDLSSAWKGNFNVTESLSMKNDSTYGSESTESSNQPFLHTDDSNIEGFVDNLDALSGTMGIEELLEGSPIVVQNGWHFTKDVVIKSNSFSAGNYSAIVADEGGEENTDLDCVNNRNGGSEPMELKVLNNINTEKDEVEVDSKYGEVESAAIEAAEVGGATHDSDENDGLVMQGDSGSKYKKVESGAVEAKGVGDAADDSNQNHRRVGEGDSDVVEVPPNKLDKNDASNSTQILNEASHSTDYSKISEFFADNHDGVTETVVVSGSTITTELSDMLENELANESSESFIIEENLPVDLLEGSKTMASIVVHNDSKSTEDKLVVLETSKTTKQMIEVLEESSSSSRLGTDKKGGNEIAETDSLLELLVEKTSSTTNVATDLGTSALRPRPTQPAPARQQIVTSPEPAVDSEPKEPMTDEKRRLQEKIESIRVMFLRLAYRLGFSYEDSVPASVLCRLALAEDRCSSDMHAIKNALELERGEKDKLDFSCTILVIGKSGVGKSTTINSIFGREKTVTNPFKRETTTVRKFEGMVDGIKIQMVDTPGLSPFLLDHLSNIKILRSIKQYMKKCPPDIVVYVDRLDTQIRDYNDIPIIRLITGILGSSIWPNTLIALTHASKDPPEGPSGLPLSYEAYVDHRYRVVQQSIGQVIDMKLMNPLVLVENHPYSTRNNGSIWRNQLLLLCYSSKILAEATSLCKPQRSFLKKLFWFRSQSPVNLPAILFLSSLCESKVHPNIHSDIDLDDLSFDGDDEIDEYNQLPPFYPLTKCQIAKLTEEQKSAYYDEYDYRVKLFGRIQLREGLRMLKGNQRNGNGEDSVDDDPTIKRNRNGEDSVDDDPTIKRNGNGEDSGVGDPSIGFPTCLELPPSFDCDDPVYRYRFLKPRSMFLGPVYYPQGWDHDCGFDAVNLEIDYAFAQKFPATVSAQLKKDKEDFNIEMDCSISAKHGEIGSTLASFDVHTIGGQQGYSLRAEAKFKNLKKNATTLGVALTSAGDTVATGLKLDDRLSIGNRITLAVNAGAVQTEGNVAYGANFEATLKDDHPIGRPHSSMRLFMVNDHRDLNVYGMLLSQVSIGRNSKAVASVEINNRNRGKIAVKVSSSDQLRPALVSLIPAILTIISRLCDPFLE